MKKKKISKEILCPICKNVILYSQYKQAYTSVFKNKKYYLYHCSHCNVKFWYPLKIEPEFYEKEYFLPYASFHNLKENNIFYRHKIAYNLIKKLKKQKKKVNFLLDVGCADGSFLKYCQGLGIEVTGIDLDHKSIENAKRKGLKNVYNYSLEEFLLKNKVKKKYDLITIFEVLEHQDKPKEFIKNIKKILKKEGFLLGTLPNRHRFLGRNAGLGDFPPHHFLRFDKKSLEYFFRNEGFRCKISTFENRSSIRELIESCVNFSAFFTGEKSKFYFSLFFLNSKNTKPNDEINIVDNTQQKNFLYVFISVILFIVPFIIYKFFLKLSESEDSLFFECQLIR
ncbi:MAG: class I SAM-dependent methyltransferase [Candidatus Woesearchaeota archaeon]